MNVLVRFALVLLAAIGVLVGVLSYEYGFVIRRELLEFVGRDVSDHITNLAARELPSREAFQAAAQDPGFDRFRALEQEALRIPESMRIKIWDTDRRVVFSDEPRLIGLSFPDNEELNEALKGEVTVEIGRLKSEHLFEAQIGPETRLLEVYVPLRSTPAGPPFGVAEVYVYSPVFFAHMDDARRNLWLLSSAVGAATFLALGAIFWSSWRKERRLVDELDRARRSNEEIVEHAGTGIVLLDQDLRIRSWNRSMERLCGSNKGREHVLGRHLFDVFPRLAEDPMRARLREVLESGAAYSMYAQPCPVCEKSGDRIVNTKLVCIKDSSGRPTKILMTVEDITEVRKLELQVNHSQKLATIGEMYANLTHEINNPLGVIVSKVKTLLSEAPQAGYSPSLLKDLEQIERHSGRIAEIVRNLLTFARKATFERKPVDLNALIFETVPLVQKAFSRFSVQVDLELQSDLPHVPGDAGLLRQVLMNLLNNARDAMPRGGRVWITSRLVREGNGAVVIEVKDQGSGIEPDALDKIFDPFFTTKEVGKGTGLGLSVSYGIVRSHGGDLRVKSSAGEGATFSVILPLEAQEC